MPLAGPTPSRIRFADTSRDRLVIEWDDGHAAAYPLAYLRGWCPCASCQGHGVGVRFVAGESRLAGLREVGAYALGLSFADGHGSGIYTWERLRELCPCEACDGPEEGTPPDVAEAARAGATVD